MTEIKRTYRKEKVIGAIAGLIAALISFYPIMLVRWSSMEYLNDVYGGYNDIPDLLMLLVMGFPFPAMFWIASVAIGGMIFGAIGALRAQKRHIARKGESNPLSTAKLWLWGGLSGFLINAFVSFWSG